MVQLSNWYANVSNWYANVNNGYDNLSNKHGYLSWESVKRFEVKSQEFFVDFKPNGLRRGMGQADRSYPIVKMESGRHGLE